jgi:hypothetical protein
MKNILSLPQLTLGFITLFFSFSLFISCESTGGDGSKSSPEETMKSFIAKVKANDFNAAKEFTSQRTDPVMDFMKNRIDMLKQMGKEDQINALFGGLDISQDVAIKCTAVGDNATCECCEEITGNCQSIAVIKENGKWLVDQPKESNVE